MNIRLNVIALLLVLLAAAPLRAQGPPPDAAQNFTIDQHASDALTRYLHKHRLPLVGARVGTASDGSRTVILYGFVATAFGKSDAETKSRRFLKERHLTVTNSIRIEPQVRKLHPPDQ
jgi:hypothetical protein